MYYLLQAGLVASFPISGHLLLERQEAIRCNQIKEEEAVIPIPYQKHMYKIQVRSALLVWLFHAQPTLPFLCAYRRTVYGNKPNQEGIKVSTTLAAVTSQPRLRNAM